jgi:membrane protein YfhO
MASRGLRGAAWAAVPVAAVLLAFAPAVAGLRTLAHRDTDRLYAPARTLVVEALRQGRLPLWDPYQGTGRPLFAEGSHSVLHPVSLAAALLAPASVDALLLGYLAAAALGAFLLARALGASQPASAGAALAFALAGYPVSMTGNVLFLAGLSSLPWLLAAARTAGAGGRWGPPATALATAAAFLSGDAQVAVLGVGLGLLLALDAGGWRGLARATVGVGAGGLLAGVQLAATSALLPLTTRALPLQDGERTQWALAPARLLEWVVPGLFRGPPRVVPAGASGAWLDLPFAESVYLGVPLLFAAGLGATRWSSPGRRRTALLLAAAAGAILWLALGHHLGARQLLGGVPIWSRFRYPEKLMAPLGLCLAALAALGVDAFGAGRVPPRARRALGAGALVAATALLALLAAPGATGALADRLLGDAGAFYRARLVAGLPHLLGGLAALLAADRLLRERWRAGALALLMALAVAAAIPYAGQLGDPAAHRLETPLRLEADGPTPRLAHPADGLFLPEERRDLPDVTARQRARVLSPATNVAHRVDAVGQYTPLPSLRYAALEEALGPGAPRHLRRFGVTHVAVPIPYGLPYRPAVALATEGGTLVQRDEGQRFELWTVPHRPWAFFPERALAAPEAGRALRVLLEIMARGDDGAVVVEAPARPPLAPGRVLAVERGAEVVRVEAEALGPSLLVLQDAYWPGWRATIDGRAVEVLAADVLVRAVPWPAGRHRLELTYEPPELRLGLALSGAGAVLLLALAGWAVGGGARGR